MGSEQICNFESSLYGRSIDGCGKTVSTSKLTGLDLVFTSAIVGAFCHFGLMHPPHVDAINGPVRASLRPHISSRRRSTKVFGFDQDQEAGRLPIRPSLFNRREREVHLSLPFMEPATAESAHLEVQPLLQARFQYVRSIFMYCR
jgi:hypothetical protein